MPTPNYNIGQEVPVPLCARKGIIKGVRWMSNIKYSLSPNGWEYLIYHKSLLTGHMVEWGWVCESSIDALLSEGLN